MWRCCLKIPASRRWANITINFPDDRREVIALLRARRVLQNELCLNCLKSRCSPAICAVAARQGYSRRERAAREGAVADFAKMFQRALIGAKFTGLSRRGKYLLFQLHAKHAASPVILLGIWA